MTILTLTTLTTFLASLLTLSIAHANMALPSINRSLDHILVRLFTLGIAYEINIALRSFWSFGHLVKIVFQMFFLSISIQNDLHLIHFATQNHKNCT